MFLIDRLFTNPSSRPNGPTSGIRAETPQKDYSPSEATMAGASDYPPAFEGELSSWKQQMKVFLNSDIGISLIMKTGYEAPKTTNGEELDLRLWNKKQRDESMGNGRAEFHILSAIPTKDFDRVGEYKSAKELWEKFLKLYEEPVEVVSSIDIEPSSEESETEEITKTTPTAEVHPEIDEGGESSEEINSTGEEPTADEVSKV